MVAKLAAFSRNTFSSLAKRNFRLYFIGQNISLIGGWMQSVAQSWLVLHLTGSPAALGVVAALQCAPTLLLGPYAGVLVDRVPKRRVLAVTQTLLGVLALVLGLTVAFDVVRPWMVYVTAALLGVVTAIDYPTRQSFIYELSGPDELLSAVGLNSTSVNLTRIVGPALAGVLIAAVGLAACFLLNAASYVAVLVCLGLMRAGELHRSGRAGAEASIAKGLDYARRTPVVRESLVMMAIIGMITFEFSVTLPVFVKLTLHSNAAALGVLMSGMGVGAVIGGIITAGRRGDGLGRLSVAALAFGLTTAMVGFAPDLVSATVVMFFVGIFSARFTGLSNGILQLRSDPAFRNRMVALWATAFIGSSFLGGPLLGWIAEVASPRWSLYAGALGGVAAAIVGWVGLRAIERTADTAAASLPAPAHARAD